MELLKVWTALLRRKWIFLQAIVFFTVGAAAIALLLPKRYEAVSKISVESSDASLSILGEMDLGEIATSLSGSSDDMQTKIALAQMRPVLDEVIWRLQLRDLDGELLPAEKLLVPGIDGEILAMPWISIEEQQGTNILLVLGTSNNPELSALLADTLVEVYLDISVQREKKDVHEALSFVQAEQAKLRTQFDEALKNVAVALQAESVIDLDSETKAAVARASELVAEISATEAELAAVQAQMRARAELNASESVAALSPATAQANQQIGELRAKLTELVLVRKKELLDKTPKHPDVIDLDAQIHNVQAELDRLLVEQHARDPQVDTMRLNYAGLLEKRAELLQAVEQTIAEAGTYPEKGRKIAELQLAAEATETVYKSLIEQEYQIAVAEAMTVSDLKPVEPAKAPDKPAAPKLIVYTILGCIVGIGVGFGLVFLFEYVDDSVKGQEDLREVWSLPVLGLVPRVKLKSGPLIHHLPATDPLFEAYRAIRNGIAFAGVDQRIDVVTVTSCVPGEGKSTFASNLAICLAQDGQRVVVVDCDLRRPTQHKAFPTLANDRGVSTVLSQATPIAEAVQETPVANLSVLTSGPLPSNPGRLVESLRMRQLLQELARSYDMVIVDAPPVLAVADAISLARASRGTVVVLESGKTTRRMVADLRHRMEAGAVEPTGVVLNKVDARTGQYGYYRAYAQMYAKPQGGEPPKAKGSA
ncbi:MAG: GumC family protein [Myxococcota bacterium]